MTYPESLDLTRRRLAEELLKQEPIDVGEWQSMDVSYSSLHATRELMDVVLKIPVPTYAPDWVDQTKCDLPWAEEHFLERVSGTPHNPPPSHVDWPYAVRGNTDHTSNAGTFDHTYPERFWPKWAGDNWMDDSQQTNRGIRFLYGDLRSMVDLLAQFPLTRQAYLPVWFPEDTGGHARAGSPRVPCTLGYHFMIRYGILTCRYYLRSCDIRRHMHNDIYMAGRLMHWVRDQVHANSGPRVITGTLTAYISSLHSFVADDQWLRGMMDA